MRSARLVGADLAKFYLALGQPDIAITFLTGALGGYLDDHWSSLVADTQLQIVECCVSSPSDIKQVTLLYIYCYNCKEDTKSTLQKVICLLISGI